MNTPTQLKNLSKYPYISAFVIWGVFLGIKLLIKKYAGGAEPPVLSLSIVLIASLIINIRPIFMLVGCSILAEIYFFTEPFGSFKIPSGVELASIIAYSVVNISLATIVSKQSKIKADLMAIHVEQRKWISNISHEIKSPLTGIVGLVKLLNETDSRSSLHKQYLALINQTTDQLKALVSDLLDLSTLQAKAQRLTPVVFPFADEVSNLIEVFKIRAMQKNLDLVFEANDLPRLLQGDRIKLFQVISNLVDNAIKFTDIGSITIRISSSTNFANQKRIIRCHVIDTGPGLSESEIQMVFEPFFKTINNRSMGYQGAGLGLSICKELVSMLNGTIGVTSKGNNGCNFWLEVEFPEVQQYESKSSASLEVVRDTSKINADSIHVLVAEDNLPTKIVLEKYFKKACVNADFVNDGKSALKAASNKRYDLIFLDWSLPLLSGPMAAIGIREIYKEKGLQTLFVGTTASATSDVNFQKNKSAFDSVLLKPLEEGIFLDFISESIEFLSKSNAFKEDTSAQQRNKCDIAIKRKFIDEYPCRQKKIQKVFDQKNWSELQNKVHNLKSSCLAVNGLAASDLCSDLENSCIELDIIKIYRNFPLLDKELEFLYTQLKNEVFTEEGLSADF